jgi:hypothetical protein
MRFHVQTEPDGEHDLHLAWVWSKDPAAVRAANDSAKELLANDPAKAGEHISEGLWRLDLPPLRFQYEIDFTEHIVTISNISLLAGHDHQ